jgi:hypothetical protein
VVERRKGQKEHTGLAGRSSMMLPHAFQRICELCNRARYKDNYHDPQR